MFGLKKFFNNGVAAAKKMENKNQLEATIAGAVLVGWADGNFSADEVSTLEAVIMANENLNHFGAEIGLLIERFNSLMVSGATLGRVKVMKEIADCKGNEEECIEVLATLIDIAKADGEVGTEEKAVLESIAKTLGLSLSMFGDI